MTNISDLEERPSLMPANLNLSNLEKQTNKQTNTVEAAVPKGQGCSSGVFFTSSCETLVAAYYQRTVCVFFILSCMAMTSFLMKQATVTQGRLCNTMLQKNLNWDDHRRSSSPLPCSKQG